MASAYDVSCTYDKTAEKVLKICDDGRTRKIGVVVAGFDELLSSIESRFPSFDRHRDRVLVDEDGTEVDNEDYFQTLPADTLLRVASHRIDLSSTGSKRSRLTERTDSNARESKRVKIEANLDGDVREAEIGKSVTNAEPSIMSKAEESGVINLQRNEVEGKLRNIGKRQDGETSQLMEWRLNEVIDVQEQAEVCTREVKLEKKENEDGALDLRMKVKSKEVKAEGQEVDVMTNYVSQLAIEIKNETETKVEDAAVKNDVQVRVDHLVVKREVEVIDIADGNGECDGDSAEIDNSFEIVVRVLHDNINIALAVKPSDTIKALKTKIHSTGDFHPSQQYIIFSGRCLEDGRTISDCNIPHASIVFAVVNTRELIVSEGSSSGLSEEIPFSGASQQDFEQHVVKRSVRFYRCVVCQTEPKPPKAIFKHIVGRQHRTSRSGEIKPSEKQLLTSPSSELVGDENFGPVLKPKDRADLSAWIEANTHITVIFCEYIRYTHSVPMYVCQLCNTEPCLVGSITGHIRGSKHEAKSKKKSLVHS